MVRVRIRVIIGITKTDFPPTTIESDNRFPS